MKIALFTDSYLDVTGGIVTAINAQKKALEEAGHTVYLFSAGYRRSKNAKTRLAHENIFVVPSCRLFFRGLVPVARRPKIVERWILWKHPEIKDFDIFHSHYEAGCSIAGIRLGKKLDIPVVQTMHGREDMGVSGLVPLGLRTLVSVSLNMFHSWYLPHTVRIKKDQNFAKTRVRARMWTLMINHANQADLVLTPSEHFKKKLADYGVTKPIEVLPNGVKDSLVDEPAEVKTLAAGEPIRIIWHNRVTGEKRLMPFLNALRMVGPTKYKMDVFGGGNDLKRAGRFVKKYHMPVTFHGDTDFENFKNRLSRSHLDVLVSINYDTFGMTLIEAEAAGVPVLFCDPDMREIVPEGGFIMCRDTNSVAMAEAINKILAHPECIEAMSKVMIKHRDEVRQSKQTGKLIKYYKGLLG